MRTLQAPNEAHSTPDKSTGQTPTPIGAGVRDSPPLAIGEAEGGGWALAEGYGIGRWPGSGGESWYNILRFIGVRDRGEREVV